MRWPVLVLRTAHFAVECTAELYDFNPVVAIFAGSDNVLVFLPTPTEFTVGCTSAIRIAFVLPCVQIDLQLEIQLCGAVTAHTHTHTSILSRCILAWLLLGGTAVHLLSH